MVDMCSMAETDNYFNSPCRHQLGVALVLLSMSLLLNYFNHVFDVIFCVFVVDVE